MKKFFLDLALVVAAVGAVSCSQTEQRLVDYVDPMVGTDFTGHTFPGATAPFGMVQLSPDTRIGTWEGCSGYHYSDNIIFGFSHTHLSGTGVLDYGDVLMMPVTAYDADSLNRELYQSEFSHSREEARAGYYSVELDRWNVLAEMTAGPRSGMHRYTYRSGQPMMIIDLQHRDDLLGSSIALHGDSVITGYRRSKSWSEDQMVHFYIEFSEPVADYRPFGDEGALIVFSEGTKQVLAKVGISSVSSDNARLNLLSDVPEDSFDFEALLASSQDLWEAYLSKIDVRGGGESRERLRTFYTAMYHTAIAPNLYSDVNGEYRGMDKQIHKAEGYDRYTVFSTWDTFRTLHPMFALIERERTEDFLRSFLSIYEEGGKLPMWELAGYETNCMIGYNSVSIIADALEKGIGEEYAAELLDAMVATANKDELGIRFYRERNIVPAEEEHESVSKTVEYAYDDWCISQVAAWLYDRTGDEKYADIRDKYLRYSSSYINVLDPATKLMRPVLNGAWVTPFDPHEVNNHYTEANSWQYSFFAPHDISGHIALLGGDEGFEAMLDSLFAADSNTKGRKQVDITGLVGQYAHGNEPSHQTAYLYAYVGKPWKTYEKVRYILDELYSSAPDGLCGNDDCGQMSAWYVMSAIGLYPVTPGNDMYVLSSPVFKNVVLNLENGNKFLIKSEPQGSIDHCKYISSVLLDGKEYTKSYVNFSDIIKGGELDLTLVAEPDKDFGAAVEDRPMTRGCGDFVRNPWFESAGDIFEDTLSVSVNSGTPGNTAYIKVGNGLYHKYDGPVILDKTTRVSIYAKSPDGVRSPEITAVFHKMKDEMDIYTENEYNPQYNARGPRGLIDGIRGSVNWKTGGWQGYQATDFTAVVDLRKERRVSLVGSGYCQDARAWIWMPRYVEYSVSDDGKNFTTVGRVDNTVDERDYNIQTKDFVLKLDKPVKARYVKIFAKNFGTIPGWHLGAGGEGFIFIDEIWVD
ncbi:MAG TPA: GH92 family glycosyl hydrolase [Candidatus Coprenecus pullistercoris]|nr:GH92 family glycosyl hydrolase [Candidatus Coprenecus pullistercoris]